jgi:hypothetical protein
MPRGADDFKRKFPALRAGGLSTPRMITVEQRG